MDTLMDLINSNQLGQLKLPAKPECMDTDQQVLFTTAITADPLPIGPGEWQGGAAAAYKLIAPSTPPLPTELPAPSRKLVFDAASIDRAGVPALMRVYLDGYMGFSPFIKYFPAPSDILLPAQFKPEEERHPSWEAPKLRDQWTKRRYVAFEVCRQASALQQAVDTSICGRGSQAGGTQAEQEEVCAACGQHRLEDCSQQSSCPATGCHAGKQEEWLPPSEHRDPEHNVAASAGRKAGCTSAQKQWQKYATL